MASFTSISVAQSTQTSIQVEGAGAARVVGLAAFTEVPDQLSSEPGIHVAGAGFCAQWGFGRRSWGSERGGHRKRGCEIRRRSH